jgi:hypothetical protein
MKFKSLFACAVFATTLPSLAIAADKKEAGSGPNPFSDCGIGAALFPTQKVLAVTSNVIWDVGTTALTSATASPETCSGKNVTAAKFILDSYDSLAEETARGQGQHLDALLSILEVEKSSQAAVIASIRAQMSQKVATADYTAASKAEKSSQYYESVVAALPAA